MSDPFEIEAQGGSEFVVRLRGDRAETESWFRLSPGLREELGLEVDDEERVRRTVRFLLRLPPPPPGRGRRPRDRRDRGRRRRLSRPPRRRPRLTARSTRR